MRKQNETEISAALYIRLSRDDNNGNLESMSIGNQRDYLLNYTQERGWKVFDVYIEACDIIEPTQRNRVITRVSESWFNFFHIIKWGEFRDSLKIRR